MSSSITAYHVRPQCEFKAARDCEREGIAYKNPTEEVPRRSRGRMVMRPVPLLRSYIHAQRRPARSEYIGRVVGVVPEAEIIRLCTTADRIQRRLQAARPFCVGDRVRVKVGTFAGLSGTITEDRGKKWEVSVQMFGRACPVVLRQRDIMRLIDYGRVVGQFEIVEP